MLERKWSVTKTQLKRTIKGCGSRLLHNSVGISKLFQKTHVLCLVIMLKSVRFESHMSMLVLI